MLTPAEQTLHCQLLLKDADASELQSNAAADHGTCTHRLPGPCQLVRTASSDIGHECGSLMFAYRQMTVVANMLPS